MPPLPIPRSVLYPTPVAASLISQQATTSSESTTFDYFDFMAPNPTVDALPAPEAVPQFSPEQLSALQWLQGCTPSHSGSPEDTPTPGAVAPVTVAASSIPTPALAISIPTPMPLHATRAILPTMPIPAPLTGDSLTPSDVQLAAWKTLADKYGDERLRRHQWEWLTSGPKPNTYLPYYQYQPVSKITDVWTEWTIGVNGFLPTRELDEGWGDRPCWRRNKGPAKNEASRRKKVVDLTTPRLRVTVDHDIAMDGVGVSGLSARTFDVGRLRGE
ncbi:hypothetical protein B0H19DRAFT_1078165 [Mycena capillaripes]|nr:hypothetical protein B0H19DRAFT_1078165 [Mycena capillaripes]